MSKRRWLLVAAFVLALAACVLWFPCTILDGEGWVRSASSISTVGAALRTYHEEHGRLPPAVVTSKDGRPLYSWRVLLLPYLDLEMAEQFKRDEPWDSPQNTKLLARTPKDFKPILGGADAPGLTRYQVLVGPGTAFERDGLTWTDFPDGLSGTLLVVEGGEAVPWSKPVDLTYDPAGPFPSLGGVYSKPIHLVCLPVWRTPGFVACFADGSVRFIPSKTDEKTLRSLISRDGGEKVDLSRFE
jgi:hypothetical protein